MRPAFLRVREVRIDRRVVADQQPLKNRRVQDRLQRGRVLRNAEGKEQRRDADAYVEQVRLRYGLSSSAASALRGLIALADAEGRVSASEAEIGEAAGVARVTASRGIERLEERHGIVTSHGPRKRNGGRPKAYRVRYDVIAGEVGPADEVTQRTLGEKPRYRVRCTTDGTAELHRIGPPVERAHPPAGERAQPHTLSALTPETPSPRAGARTRAHDPHEQHEHEPHEGDGFSFHEFDPRRGFPKSIRPRHLKDPRAVEELWRIAVLWDDVAPSEAARQAFYATAAFANRAKKPGAAMYGAVKTRRYDRATDADHDWARKAIRAVDAKARQPPAAAVQTVARSFGSKQGEGTKDKAEQVIANLKDRYPDEWEESP